MHGEGAGTGATSFTLHATQACRGAGPSGVPVPRVRFRRPGCHAGSCHNSPRTGSVKLCNRLLLQLCDSNTLRYIVLARAGAARHISMHVNTAAARARNCARDALRGAMELPRSHACPNSAGGETTFSARLPFPRSCGKCGIRYCQDMLGWRAFLHTRRAVPVVVLRKSLSSVRNSWVLPAPLFAHTWPGARAHLLAIF
jgi:hypothetical protein